MFGQTAAMEGPASALGQGMNAGIMAAFQEANKKGGIRGRQLDLVVYDDRYEPDNAIKNTNKLIEKDKVFALIGGVGTPTANAIEPITTVHKVPFIAPFTGAGFLREPFKRYVVNLRASYNQETEEWIERLTTDLGVKKIAILYQDDTYGRAGLNGVKAAMEKRGMSLVGEGIYKRNTTAIKAALLSIRKSNPEAVVMVGAYKPCAEFIKVAQSINFNPLFVNISFVGSEALATELGNHGAGVIVSQVVPDPYDTDKHSQLVAEYQKALKAYKPDAEFGFVSLEGYIAGRFVIEVLLNMPDDITRELFINKIYETKNFMLADLALHFDEKDNQGMDQVFMTVLEASGRFTPVERLGE
ncbi:MAG: ABC transporter substrate-binding protein [Alphaproteobacteria bacterium]|nr:ABC transporter substrate-binding protein [Alphaproteobacteria bacterium]